MTIPEKVKFLKKSRQIKTKRSIPCHIGIDNVKELSFEKIRKIVTEERDDFFKGGVHHRSFKEKGL